MRVIIFGSSSEVAKAIIPLYSAQEIISINRDHYIFNKDSFFVKDDLFCEEDIIIYISSILYSDRIENQTYTQIFNSNLVNTIIPIRLIKYLDKNYSKFTFCYISSESAKKGSFDDSYHVSKGATDNFIREFRLGSKESRIFSIAPSTIESGMTNRRKDLERLNRYREEHPKKRFITADEIAKIIKNLCSDEFNYLSNTTVEINGGKFTRNIY